MTPTCLDCSRPIDPEGRTLRCRTCHGRRVALGHAVELAAADAELLRVAEGLSLRALGARLGVSHMQAKRHVQGARRRAALREEAARLNLLL